MPEAAAALPLFPLHTVLVPGAALDLRIFEEFLMGVTGSVPEARMVA